MSGGLLLDTCTLIWLVSDQPRISAAAREAISAEAGEMHVSAISAFEVGVKHSRGRLVLPCEPWRWFRAAVEHHNIHVISISARVAMEATGLPRLHSDPSDRIIVATAQKRKLTIVTPDQLIKAYPNTSVVW